MDPLIFLIKLIINLLYLTLAVRIILPFMPISRDNAWVKWNYDLTDPLLNPIRQGLPPDKIGFDAAPFVLILGLYLIEHIINYVLGGI